MGKLRLITHDTYEDVGIWCICRKPMTTQTYTNDGETEHELVYEVPDDADDDHTVYVVEADAEDGARSEAITLGEFEANFEEYDPNAKEVAYLRERARNGYGIQ